MLGVSRLYSSQTEIAPHAALHMYAMERYHRMDSHDRIPTQDVIYDDIS